MEEWIWGMSWNCPFKMMSFSFSKSYRLLFITPDYHRDTLCESCSLAGTRTRVEDPDLSVVVWGLGERNPRLPDSINPVEISLLFRLEILKRLHLETFHIFVCIHGLKDLE